MPCIGPLHRPRGCPKPDFDFAYLSYPPKLTHVGISCVSGVLAGEISINKMMGKPVFQLSEIFSSGSVNKLTPVVGIENKNCQDNAACNHPHDEVEICTNLKMWQFFWKVFFFLDLLFDFQFSVSITSMSENFEKTEQLLRFNLNLSQKHKSYQRNSVTCDWHQLWNLKTLLVFIQSWKEQY